MKNKSLYSKLYKLQFAAQKSSINKIVNLEDYIGKKIQFKRVLSYKKILRTKLAYSVICWVGAKYIKFVSFTNSWSFINKKYVENLWKKNEAFILCFWHGRLLMMPLSWNKKKKINVLISTH